MKTTMRRLAATAMCAALVGLGAGGCYSKPDRVGAGGADARDRIDARGDDEPDADACEEACTAAGGECDDGTCVIDQNRSERVTCPDGIPCRVICDANNACKMGVDCAGATTCEVACTADSACKDEGVDCGDAETCTVVCEGRDACKNGGPGIGWAVDCGASVCEVSCTGMGACEEGVGVDPGGSCTAHCCDGGCPVVDPACARDMVCP